MGANVVTKPTQKFDELREELQQLHNNKPVIKRNVWHK